MAKVDIENNAEENKENEKDRGERVSERQSEGNETDSGSIESRMQSTFNSPYLSAMYTSPPERRRENNGICSSSKCLAACLI